MTLKTYCSNSPAISFCLDARYWDLWASVFLLVNLTNLSITEQMFDKDTILGCLRLGLLAAKGGHIESVCTKGTCAKIIYAGDASVVKHSGIHLQFI